MRYVYVPVLARNVLFSKESEELLKSLEKKAANPAVKRYVTSNLRKWLINEYPAKEHTAQSGDPQYIKQALERGDTVYDVDISKEKNKFSHYIDYLNTLPESKVPKISVPQLEQQVCKWDVQLSKNLGKSAIEAEDGISVVGKFDGFTWVDVYGRQSLKKEGDEMGHCVGGYYRQVKNGDTKIYSLRDANNQPHVTIEYNVPGKEIVQIKGKQNKPPVDKYRASVISFLESLDVRSVDPEDFIKMGIYPEEEEDDGSKINFIDFKKDHFLNISGNFQLQFPGYSQPFELNLRSLHVGYLELDTVNLTVQQSVQARSIDLIYCDLNVPRIEAEYDAVIVDGEISCSCEISANSLTLNSVYAKSTLYITANECSLLGPEDYTISGSIDTLTLDSNATVTFADDVDIRFMYNENGAVFSPSNHPVIAGFGDNNHFDELDITYCDIKRIPSGFRAETLTVDFGDLPRQIAKDVSVDKLVLNVFTDFEEDELDSILEHLAKFNYKKLFLGDRFSRLALAELLESKGIKID